MDRASQKPRVGKENVQHGDDDCSWCGMHDGRSKNASHGTDKHAQIVIDTLNWVNPSRGRCAENRRAEVPSLNSKACRFDAPAETERPGRAVQERVRRGQVSRAQRIGRVTFVPKNVATLAEFPARRRLALDTRPTHTRRVFGTVVLERPRGSKVRMWKRIGCVRPSPGV